MNNLDISLGNNNGCRTKIYPLRYLTRVVVQFNTPFLIGGEADFFSEAVFVSDPNGLPTIPGRSIAGLLRHDLKGILDDSEIQCLFGYQDNDEGKGSRLWFSFGCIHNQDNVPVEGLISPQELNGDNVLRHALFAMQRDHVRIGHKGTAVDKGKFDEINVSAGHRFTFEIVLEGNEADSGNWGRILDLLASGKLRIGGKTKRGYGAFGIVSVKQQVFDQRIDNRRDAFRVFPVELKADGAFPPEPDTPKKDEGNTANFITATIKLSPEGFWMFGGGYDEVDEPDTAPITESVIKWPPDRDEAIEYRLLVPAASIKGALSHRIAYYYNALTKTFLGSSNAAEYKIDDNKAVRELFGYARKGDDGHCGRVVINDTYVSNNITKKLVDHISIDRFTGGARTKAGALFTEKSIYKGEPPELKLMIMDCEEIKDSNIRMALKLALRDLSEGLLALGAGAGRGLGFFKGHNGGIKWSDNGKWINKEES